MKYSPSAFNSNTAHAVVLLGDNHQKLWDITYAELAKLLPTDEAKATTKGKLIILRQHMEQFYSLKTIML